MARRNVYLPDDLAAQLATELPDLNLSATVRDHLAALLDCDHRQLACADCASRIDRHQVIAGPMSQFYRQLLDEIELLVYRAGTAEGAARIVRRVAEAHQVTGARARPLPRPTRTERQRAQVRDMFPPDNNNRRRTA